MKSPEENRPSMQPGGDAGKPSGLSAFFELFAETRTPPAVVEPANSALKPGLESVFWAMRDIPVSEAVKSFMICGAPGSGKTKAIQLFLKSISARFRKSTPEPEQLIIFDAKGDVIPLLASMDIRADLHEELPFYILNPFDTRCAAWNLGEAVQGPGMSDALAALLVPEERAATAPYFAQSAQNIVRGVIMALNEVQPGNWSLRDLLCALQSKDTIRRLTLRFPPASAVVQRYLDDQKHIFGVLSTIATKLGKFEAVAALWNLRSGGDRFSVDEFLKRPGVLILGNDPVLRESIWPMNAVILQALTNKILSQPETRKPRFWFVLDEFRAMERVDCIHSLLNRGRSKGACVVLGIQSIEGIVSVYDENPANDLLGMCAYKTFLRAGSARTAEWAEKHFNQVRYYEESYSEGSGGSSVSRSLHDRSLFLASTFLNLPFPVAGKDYCAISDVPCEEETIFTRKPFNEVLALCNESQNIGVPACSPVNDPKAHFLHPWKPEEETKFIPSDPDPKSETGASKNSDADSGPKSKDPSPKTGEESKPAGSGLADMPSSDDLKRNR